MRCVRVMRRRLFFCRPELGDSWGWGRWTNGAAQGCDGCQRPALAIRDHTRRDLWALGGGEGFKFRELFHFAHRRFLFLLLTTLYCMTQRAGMFAVEGFLYTFAHAALCRICHDHPRPSRHLQYDPMPAADVQRAYEDQQFLDEAFQSGPSTTTRNARAARGFLITPPSSPHWGRLLSRCRPSAPAPRWSQPRRAKSSTPQRAAPRGGAPRGCL